MSFLGGHDDVGQIHSSTNMRKSLFAWTHIRSAEEQCSGWNVAKGLMCALNITLYLVLDLVALVE